MHPLARKLLLLGAALVLAFDGVAHAILFGAKGMAAAKASDLPGKFGAELGALWIWDAVILVTLAIVLAVVAFKPAAASRAVLMLLALLPASLAVILRIAVGWFYPEYTLGAAALLILVAGWITAPASAPSASH